MKKLFPFRQGASMNLLTFPRFLSGRDTTVYCRFHIIQSYGNSEEKSDRIVCCSGTFGVNDAAHL
jgi:hypothetical protein